MLTPNSVQTIEMRQVLTRYRCQIQSATWQTTGFCTSKLTNLEMNGKDGIRETDLRIAIKTEEISHIWTY